MWQCSRTQYTWKDKMSLFLNYYHINVALKTNCYLYDVLLLVVFRFNVRIHWIFTANPLQKGNAESHSRPTGLQLQTLVWQPVEWVHCATFNICAGAGSVIVVTGNSLSPTVQNSMHRRLSSLALSDIPTNSVIV